MKDTIQELLDYKHKITKENTANLSQSELTKLFDMLKSGKEDFILKKIIVILSVAAPDMVRDQLKEMIKDEQQPEDMRILIASCLNNSKDEQLESFYLELFASVELSFQLKLKLIKGLGKFGTKKSLETIDAFQKEFPMYGIPKLSKLLILSRNRLSGQMIFDHEPVSYLPVGRRENIKWTTKTVANLEQFELYGMDASKEAILYKCGKTDFVILKNATLARGDENQYQLASVIAAKSKYNNTYYTLLLLFLTPMEGKEMNILGFRTDGLLAYAGRLDIEGNFQVSSIKKFGSDQVSVVGKLTDKSLVIEKFLSSNKLTAKKKPTKIKL